MKFDTHHNHTKMKFSQIKPWIRVAIYSTSVISCFYYCMYNSYTLFKLFMPFMGTYFTVDLFIEPNVQYKIHHLARIYIFAYTYYYQVELEYAAPLLSCMLLTEISNLFLVSRYWIKESSYLYYANNAMFYLTFAKYRVHGIYYGLIHHTSGMYAFVDKYTPNSIPGFGIIMSVYILYGLNLYWFAYINRKAYNMLVKHKWINSEKICQYMCSYTYCVSIPVSIFVYKANYTVPYVYEILAISALALTSYYYHYGQYQVLETGKELPNNYGIMLVDNMALNARAFSSLYVNYYTSPNSRVVYSIAGFGHVSSVLLVVYTMYRNSQNKFATKDAFYMNVYRMCFYPLFIDMVFNCINTTREYYNPILLVNWFVVCIFLVEPFDKLNHAAFHLLLMKHTYYQCVMNAHNNIQ